MGGEKPPPRNGLAVFLWNLSGQIAFLPPEPDERRDCIQQKRIYEQKAHGEMPGEFFSLSGLVVPFGPGRSGINA